MSSDFDNQSTKRGICDHPPCIVFFRVGKQYAECVKRYEGPGVTPWTYRVT